MQNPNFSLAKKLINIFLLLCPLIAVSAQAENLSPENFHGYFRTGFGFNSKGGPQVEFHNPNAGKEFRLGNETSTYGELAYDFVFYKSKDNHVQYKATFMHGLKFNNNTFWESTKNKALELAILQASFEATLPLAGRDIGFWLGKKFYRSVDIYMNDFYYFPETNGIGAGISNLPFLSDGQLKFALIRTINPDIETLNGRLQSLIYDIRTENSKITANSTLNFYAAYGKSAGGINQQRTLEYSALSGMAAGVLLKTDLASGFNHFSIFYGKGLLQGFNIYAKLDNQTDSEDAKKAQNITRIRIVNHLTTNISDKFATHLALIYENRNNGASTDSTQVNWYSVGIHPVYFVSDHFQLAGQVGFSQVTSNKSDSTTLTRITFAPQISPAANIWSRPVMRAFISHSFWNKNAKGKIGGNPYSNNPYINNTDGTNFGFQAELWF